MELQILNLKHSKEGRKEASKQAGQQVSKLSFWQKNLQYWKKIFTYKIKIEVKTTTAIASLKSELKYSPMS